MANQRKVLWSMIHANPAHIFTKCNIKHPMHYIFGSVISFAPPCRYTVSQVACLASGCDLAPKLSFGKWTWRKLDDTTEYSGILQAKPERSTRTLESSRFPRIFYQQ